MQITQETIDELKQLREFQIAGNETFTEAIKAQAEQYDLPRGALRKYICALVDGPEQSAKVDEEADALLDLMRGGT